MLHTTNIIIRLSWLLAVWSGTLSFVDHVQPPAPIALLLVFGVIGATLAIFSIQQPFPIWRDDEDMRYSATEAGGVLLGQLALAVAPKLVKEVPPALIENTQAALTHLSTFINRLADDESPSQRLIVKLRAALDQANAEKKEHDDVPIP